MERGCLQMQRYFQVTKTAVITEKKKIDDPEAAPQRLGRRQKNLKNRKETAIRGPVLTYIHHQRYEARIVIDAVSTA